MPTAGALCWRMASQLDQVGQIHPLVSPALQVACLLLAPWQGWDLKESDTLTGGGRMREQLPFSHFRFHLRQEGTVSC